MFECVSEHAGEALVRVARMAIDECKRLKNSHVSTEHLLLALTRDQDNIPAQALATMKIDSESAEREVSKLLKKKQASEPPATQLETFSFGFQFADTECALEEDPPFSETALSAISRAQDYACFLGCEKTAPEHLLLALMEIKNAGALKVFEELSINLTYLKQQLMHLIAAKHFAGEYFTSEFFTTEPFVIKSSRRSETTISLRSSLVKGLKKLVTRYEKASSTLSDLNDRSGVCFTQLPGHRDILHMVCLGYMADLLYTQVALQRYVLEEMLELLKQHTGVLDEELSASIVSTAAQNIRLEVRKTIEYVWSHEYKLLKQMLDDAEHDLIGSLIEDLWWAQSEEIALNDLFAEAMQDHRRTQLLNLQKRRIEISQRLSKLRSRLDDTIRQCFTRRSISA